MAAKPGVSIERTLPDGTLERVTRYPTGVARGALRWWLLPENHGEPQPFADTLELPGASRVRPEDQ
jgi:hypothetical protein